MNLKKYMYLMAAGIMTTACSNENFTPSNEGGKK